MYASCNLAITAKVQNATTSNVSVDARDVRCPHKASECDWVGYNTHYACLQTPTTNKPRVHYGVNASKFMTTK